MRIFVIAVVVISLVLILSDISDAKKSHSNRKKRSDVENPTKIDKKSNNNDVKHHDKQKQKKRLSGDDIDTEVPTPDEQNHKHKKLRHHKKYKTEESVSSNKKEVKSGHKSKCEKSGKCERERAHEDAVHDVNSIHSDDDGSISSSASESSSSTMNNQKQQKKKEKNYESRTAENPGDHPDAKKQKKYNKSKNMKKSKYEDKKNNKLGQETPSDIDAEDSVQQTDEKYSTQNQVDAKLNSRKTRSTKPNNDKKKEEEDEAVPEEVPLKKRSSRSSDHVDIDAQQDDNVPEICLNDAANDNQDPLHKSCEI